MTDASETAVQRLEGDLRAHLARAVDSIPRITGARVTAKTYPKHFAVDIRMEGWSPTLHAVRIVRIDSLQMTRAALDEAADVLPRAIDAIATLQRSRAQDAARMGHARPLPTREIGHLDIDPALPALRGDGPDATRKAILEAVRRAHSTSNDYSGGAAMRAGGVLLGDRRAEDGRWLRICAPNVKLRSVDGRRQATLRAFELDLEAEHLPDTVLAALAGRPLRDLVEIHPLLDDRTIRKAANRTGKARPGILVGLDMQVDPIDEVLGAQPEALAA